MLVVYLGDVGDDHAGFVGVRVELLEESVDLLAAGHATGRGGDVAHQARELLRPRLLMRLLFASQVNHLFVMLHQHVVRHDAHPVRAQQKRPQLCGPFLHPQTFPFDEKKKNA